MSESNHKRIRRRPDAIQLTEQEIQDFIAHSDDDDSQANGIESDESDWDDLKETDLAEIGLVLDAQSGCCSSSSVAGNARPNTKSCSTNFGMQPSCSKTGLKDVGVDSLFGPSHSNSNLDENPSCDTKDVSHLFGSDSDSDFELEGLDDPDDKQDRTLSKCGIEIQASLNAVEHKKKEQLIERQVEQTVQKSAVVDSKTASSLSVSAALAACAQRRKNALDAINKAAVPFTSTSINQPSHQTKRPKSIQDSSQGHKQSLGSDVSGDCWIAKPTVIRVYRSVVSSELWSNRTSDRQVYSLAQLMRRCRTGLSQSSTKQSIILDESVVVGVIGSKLEPRRSRNDRIYSVWCLSDLENVGPGSSDGCVRLMLFGPCHEKLWKETEGTVVAILNPKILLSNTNSSNGKDLTLALDSPLHAMILGHSPDFGICSATTKSSQKCFQIINNHLCVTASNGVTYYCKAVNDDQVFVNKMFQSNVCRYCDYHVKKAYYEASWTRPGFVTSSLVNPKFGARSYSRYSGDLAPVSEPGVYSLPIRPDVQSIGPRKRVQLTMSKLTAAGYEVDLSTGLGGNTKKRAEQIDSAQAPLKTAKSLNDAEEKLVSALRKPSAGSLNLLKHLKGGPTATPPPAVSPSPESQENQPKRPKLTDEPKTSKPVLGRSTSFKEFFASMASQRDPTSSDLKTAKSKFPEFIDLGPLPETPGQTLISGARLRAISLVNSQGGVKAFEKKTKINRQSDLLTKLGDNRGSSSPLSQILGNSTSANSANIQTSNTSTNPTDSEESLALKNKKRLRLERLQNLSRQIKQGSAHTNLVVELENQTEDARLANLEKRDEFEQKLIDKTEEACTFVCCETCNYRSFKAAPDCLKNNHTIKYRKGHKRYFSCRNCHKRTMSLDRYPTKSCANCGESLFEKTGVLAERKGPKLPHETLLSRGLEEKFLG